ncbi:MAG TPA: TonB family protein [Prolixibacteraceae bacterium]|jgi:TonB family protein
MTKEKNLKQIFASATLQRELRLFVFLFVVALGTLPQVAVSQEVTHTFKIVGKERISVHTGKSLERLVEYDPNSSNHLYITDYGQDGLKLDKSQFLFIGEKFNVSNLLDYIVGKELKKDGVKTIFSVDQLVANELIYKSDTLQRQTTFYRNGNKQMTYMGDEKAMNGEFKMWLPDGQLTFSGNYKNNFKDGVFESFDPSVNQNRKGVYAEGKLISGESVVQDFVYDAPEVSAQPIGGDSILNEYLKMKTADLPSVKALAVNTVKEINLSLTIDKNGQTDEMNFLSTATPTDQGIVNAIFNEFPNFHPALLEGAPVRSTRKLNLVLSNKGLQVQPLTNNQTLDNENDLPYTVVEQMPEFVGGEVGLRKYLSNTVRYPIEAAEKGIQGKVFVNFIVAEDGSISHIKVVRGVHGLLDAEACRVISRMPKWIPGRQSGKTVRVSYTVPINFITN